MGKRFAIVLGVAAAGVMSLGAQTAAAAPNVVKYGTEVTITREGHHEDGAVLWHGGLSSKARKCVAGRHVVLFRQRRGADRRLGSSDAMPGLGWGAWGVMAPTNGRVYAKANETPVCRADRSRIIENGDLCPEDPEEIFVCRADRSPTVKRSSHPRSLRAQAATSSTVGPVDTTPPDLQLSGPRTQHAEGPDNFCDSRACDVIVEVSCGDETCTERSTGKLTKVKNDKLEPDGNWRVAPGETLKGTGPEMSDVTQRKQVRKALNEGKNVKAKVTVRAWDAAGNVATRHRTITFK